MADTLVEGAVSSSLDNRNALWGPYYSDVGVGVIVYVDSSLDLRFTRTTAKGASWSNTLISAGGVVQVACWYDKETPGNSGTLLHVAWLDWDNDIVRYCTIDVATGSLGELRTVDSTVTVGSGTTQNRIAITQTVSGNIIIGFSTQTEVECYKSSDNFATAGTDIANVFETATQEDWVLLFPAATTDDNDACAAFWDRDWNIITLKMYDDSLDTWTEFATPIASPAYDDSSHINMDGSVRHSDSRIEFAWHSDDDAAGDDLKTAELRVDSILSPTITPKTNIFTNQGESAQVCVFINQQNDDIYVGYLKGGTWQSAVDVVYHISVDGMTSWGVEQSYSQAAAGDIRLVSAGRTVGSNGGRYQPAFYNDDLTAIYVNEVLDLELGIGAVEGQAALSGVGSISAVASLVLPGAASPSGVGTMVVAGTIGVVRQGVVVLAGVGSLTPAAVASLVGQVSMDGVGSLAVTAERIVAGVTALDGVGSMSAIGEVAGLLEGRADLAGVGSLVAVGQRIVTGQAAMAGVGSLTPTGAVVVAGVVALAGVGSLTVIGTVGLYTQMGRRTFDIDVVDYPPDTLFYFEANMESDAPGNDSIVRLFNLTDAAEVSGSPITILGPGPAWGRSGSFSLPGPGVKRYRVEYGGTAGGIYTPHGAALRVVSS